MKYRQLRVTATGQWVNVLFTCQAKDGQPDVFGVRPEIHQQQIAAALGLPPTGLEVVDADSDVRVGVLLTVPPPLPNPTAPLRASLTRRTELLAIPRSDWTAAQQRELLQLIAQQVSP